MKTGALIAAAGYSSRMGFCKITAKLGPKSSLGWIAGALRKAGIREIAVVTGHWKDEVEKEARSLRCRTVHNPDYGQGMFSSVKKGLSSVPKDWDRFFFLPGDLPLIRPSTFKLLMDNPQGPLIYPTFLGKRGHPPLMSKDLIPGVLSWKGDMGLMGALENLCENPVEIPVSDQGTVLDMDFKEDCQALSDRILNLDIPTDLEIKALEAMAKTPERVLKHEAKVKDTALKIASLALEAGISIDKELLRSGALLHDLCRTEKDHPKAASVLLKSQGFDKLGDLVATHMDYPYKGLLDEGAVLYLADKLTFCDKFCTIDQRLSKMQEKFKDDENSLKWAEIRLEKARKISEDLSKIMGKDLMEALK